MKSKIVLLALFAAPSLAIAQTQTQPVRIAKAPSEPLPDAQELLDNLFTPYEMARTFRGKFDVTVQGERNLIEKISLDSLFRTDEKGRLNGQKSVMMVLGRTAPKIQQTFVFLNATEAQKIVLVEQKAWWNAPMRDNSTALFSFVEPLIEQVVAGLEGDDKFVPVVSRGVEKGRPVLILKAKKGNTFRAVLDAQTRAIRSLVVKESISIVGTDQVFNAPVSDEELSWSAPADFRQVAPGEVMPPISLGITIPGLAGANGATN